MQTGWWFLISCLANILWLLSWLYEYTGLSVIVMFLLLFSLFRIVVNTRMELYDAPISRIAFVWWPFSLDRKSTRLNSSHVAISYAVFCLKKKKINDSNTPTR